MFLCVCLYRGAQKCCCLYAYTIYNKNASINMPIFASQRIHLCLCLSYCLYKFFHIYAHIVAWKYTCLQMNIGGSQKCSSVYSSIRVSKDTPLYMNTYEFIKITVSPYLVYRIWLHLFPNGNISQYASISISTHASLYMSILVSIDAPLYISIFVV
jgi:hypothetical protein